MVVPDRFLKGGIALIGVFVWGVGCRPQTAAPPKNVPAPPPAAPQQFTLTDVKPAPVGSGDLSMKDALNGQISRQEEGGQSPLPKGARIVGMKVENGVVTLDFNKEFNGLKRMGETSESQAQQWLQATLSVYADLNQMRVTVEGKPFASEVTDWGTPFSVRGEASSEKGNDAVAKKQGTR